MTQAPSAGVRYDPFEEGFSSNPYDQLARLRKYEPIHRSAYGPVMLFRFEAVRKMLIDPNLLADDRGVESERSIMIKRAGMVITPERTMARVDPPEHTRLRALVAKAFARSAINEMRAYIEAVAQRLLSDLRAKGVFDLMADFAYPLPLHVVSELLGIPEEDRVFLAHTTSPIQRLLDISITEEHVTAAARATAALHEYLNEQIDKRRRQPGGDILSGMVLAEEAGDRLSTEEMIEMAVLLYVAGHETTTDLLGNGVLALLRYPDQLALLREGKVDIKNAVEELLRYDSPVQLHARVTGETEYTFEGTTIAPHTAVIGHCGAANHDPDKFGTDAEKLDLARKDAKQHLSFGFGIHSCVGAALSRLEGEVAIALLVGEALQLQPDDPPVFRDSQFSRGLERLPLSLAG